MINWAKLAIPLVRWHILLYIFAALKKAKLLLFYPLKKYCIRKDMEIR